MSEEQWDMDDLEEASADLYGESSVTPSLYSCSECAKQILAADVHWGQDNSPQCPTCKRPLYPVVGSAEV